MEWDDGQVDQASSQLPLIKSPCANDLTDYHLYDFRVALKVFVDHP